MDLQSLQLPLVLVDCARGDLAGARERLESHAELEVSDDIQARAGYRFAEAHVLRAEGKQREALEAAESGMEIEELGITFLTAKLNVIEALESAFALGDRARSQELIDLIDALRPGERPPLLEAQAHRFRAKLAGDEAGFRAAVRLFRELTLEPWLAITLLEHGESLAEQGRGAEAGPLVAEAREIFERLEAVPWIERAMAAAPDQAQVRS